jgi:NADPH:quinone reductase-like Zn-dependent oxidoreductase
VTCWQDASRRPRAGAGLRRCGAVCGGLREDARRARDGDLVVSDERIERAKKLGADHGINYRTTPEWAKATRDITGGRGYDLVLELGGEKTLPQSLRCIRPGGTVAMIGILSGSAMATSLGLIITRQVRLQGVTVGHRDGFEAMLRAIDQHRSNPWSTASSPSRN